MDAGTLGAVGNLTRLTGIVSAVGALGVAAYGLVDATKALGGGVSTRGFATIAKVMATLVPDTPVAEAPSISTAEPASPPILSLASILVTLKSNWINGVATEDQRAIAKTLVKLRLNGATAPVLAGVTGVDGTVLAAVAGKIATGVPLTQPETDVYGRFDLILTTMLDQAYQRADQAYRNTAKLLAVGMSVLLAFLGAWAVGMFDAAEGAAMGVGKHPGLITLLLGLLATPLAPVAKDLSSAIQAGAKAAQAWTSRS